MTAPDLPTAIQRHVTAGMHLHFSSTPSRSNAAIRELSRAFAGKDPRFVLSTTGFHSSAHTLALLALGRRYIGCFFGDNYPTPRPNGLYQALADQGALEQWSLLSYVLALRAGALGHAYAVTTSLAGTALGTGLETAGRYFQVSDPQHPERRVGLVTALVPDIAFLHAPAGTASGRVAFTAPYGEGLHGALAARHGAIVTVERLIDDATMDAAAHLVQLPRDRVLAVVEAPFGAHPQPLHVATAFAGVQGYTDDFLAYTRWREIAKVPAAFGEYRRAVLDAPDGAAAYRRHVGEGTLHALVVPPGRRVDPGAGPGRMLSPCDESVPLSAPERLVLLAARAIRKRLSERGHRSMLAGIGLAFTAARLSLLVPGPLMEPVELMIETGMASFDPSSMHPYLLAAGNAASAGRLSSIEDNLGALACGAGNHCLAVIGCAEADADGNLNSSVAKGKLLVGSGGANDLCSSAAEVLVLCRADRLVERVEFVTSTGKRVLTVVTEDAVLERADESAPWRLSQAGLGDRTASEVLAALPFTVSPPEAGAHAPPPSVLERTLLARLFAGSASATQRRRSPVHA